jgi:hypothetical protein
MAKITINNGRVNEEAKSIQLRLILPNDERLRLILEHPTYGRRTFWYQPINYTLIEMPGEVEKGKYYDTPFIIPAQDINFNHGDWKLVGIEWSEGDPPDQPLTDPNQIFIKAELS